MDEAVAQREEAKLDELVEDTRALSGHLKKRIQDLERKGGSGRDGQIRKQQTGLVKTKFVEAIQSYQEVEKQYRAKYKARMERQYKIGECCCQGPGVSGLLIKAVYSQA